MRTGITQGDPLPEFSLKDQEGNPFDSRDLQDQAVVIFFYPKDHTPGCTKEVCSFRDQFEDFTDAGARVVGISSDSIASHKGFAQKYRLPFPLLSDPDGAVRKQFGVKGHLFNLLPGRETFVFDSRGKLVMRYHHLGHAGHVENALKAIKNYEK